MAVKAANTGVIIIGGGVIKHHICNANLMVSIFYVFSKNKILFLICRVGYKRF